MSEPKHKIGDNVWRAFAGRTEEYVTCPDCAGTGRIRLIMADETHVAIPCGNCASGYEPPTGRVVTYIFKAEVSHVVIGGIRQEIDGEIEYHCRAPSGGYWAMKEDEIFIKEANAIRRAQELQDKHNAEEAKRFKGKHDGARSWAWNASYRRKEKKKAEKDLAYHSAKLTMAALMSKSGG